LAENQSATFYKALSPDYDRMTRFGDRLRAEQDMLSQWLKRYPFKSVVDVACGTGLHSIALKKLGVEVVGVDNSPEMLKQAEQNARLQNVAIKWLAAPMQNLKKYLKQSFDGLLCLGNSLPHLLSEEDLRRTLESFFALLNDGGRVVIQILNYSRILRDQERIVHISQEGDKQFIRFYDFIDPLIRFNLLTIHWQQQKASHQLISTELYPYRREELEKTLQQAGFTNLEYFGNMQFAPYDDRQSTNLVMVAEKTEK